MSKKYDGEEYHWPNVVCWGTSLQMVYPLVFDGAKTPDTVWETFVDSWAKTFGMPEMIVMDPGSEFKAYFAEVEYAKLERVAQDVKYFLLDAARSGHRSLAAWRPLWSATACPPRTTSTTFGCGTRRGIWCTWKLSRAATPPLPR